MIIPLRLFQIKEKNTSRIVLIKSFGLIFHETLLLLFWIYLMIYCIWDEAKLVMLEFYSKNAPLGLLLLPTTTKIVLLIPILMTLVSFCMLSARTTWEFDNLRQKIVKIRYILFIIRISKKEWSYSEVAYLSLEKERRLAPYVLCLVTEGGKKFFIDHCRSEKRLFELVKTVYTHTGLKLLE